MYKCIKNLKHLMRSLGNSSIKAKKQMFEAKSVIKIKLKLTGNGLWPWSTQTELQIDRKAIKKMTKLNNPNMFMKTKTFKSHNRLKVPTKK